MIIVSGEKYMDEVRTLLKEYAQYLNRDLSFQQFQNEIENLEDKYLPPTGKLLVATTDNQEIIGWF